MRIPTFQRNEVGLVLERAIREAFIAETGKSPDNVSAQHLKIYNPRWRFEVSLHGCVVRRDFWDEELRAGGSYDQAGNRVGHLLAAQWQAEFKAK